MTYVKICGLTNLEDATCAFENGADMLGFIFYKPSPRYIAPEQVREIVQTLKNKQSTPENNTRFVGVFVNEPFEFIQQTLEHCHLDLAQLHGNEPSNLLKRLAGRAFKASSPQTLAEAQTLAKTFIIDPATPILLDAYHPSLPGGTGYTSDWAIAAHIAKQYTVILAGGLTPNNVAQAIQEVKPWGVDVSSGVEAHKGKKDHAKVKAFIKAVKEKST